MATRIIVLILSTAVAAALFLLFLHVRSAATAPQVAIGEITEHTEALQASPSFILHAIDARSGKALASGSVVTWDPLFSNGQSCALATAIPRVTFPTSYLDENIEHGPTTVFVRSDGYAWATIGVNTDSPSSWVAVLHPGGQLRIRLQLDKPLSPSSVIVSLVRVEDSQLVAKTQVEPVEEVCFDGVPLGSYQVEAVGVRNGQFVTSIARAETVLNSSAPVELAVALVSEVAVQPVPVTIQIELTDEAASIPTRALIRSIGTSTSRAGVAGSPAQLFVSPGVSSRTVFTRPINLMPGEYALEVPSLAYVQSFVVHSPATDVRLRLPNYATVSVIVEADGKLFHPAANAVTLTPCIDRTPIGGVLALSTEDSAGLCAARVLEGDYLLVLDDVRVQTVMQRLRVDSERMQIRLVTSAVPSLKLELARGGFPVPIPNEWNVSIIDASGEDVTRIVSGGSGVLIARLPCEGTYEVRFGDLPGYAREAPRRLTVGPGESVNLKLELEPLR